ncbi:MAG: hypothetical protein HKO66_15035 [Saprospiraceae bacterium]|nr:hypothetical protein [Bacteroidia bacterium]NNE15429.1 hypothetical protein [Saprospiraceae bacterium]NNL93554.1 hypothetical protein [Saprospiraceae bacterium]
MKLYTYFIFCLCFAVLSCKNDTPERPKPLITNNEQLEGIEENPIKRERLEEMKKKSKVNNVPAMRVQALSILNHRLKKDSNSYAIIEADVWEYNFVFDGEMSKPGEYDKSWIDFKPDATYEYGKGSTVLGSGKYNYHFDRSELLLVDNDSSQKPQEWSVKNAGDVMILVGTSTYRDNSMQMKLERVKESIKQ